MQVGRPLLWAPLLSACRGLRALPKSFFFVYCFGLRPVIFQSLYGSVRVPSLEIRLDKFRARVNINLTKYGFPGVNESMRCVRGNDHDAARFHLVRFVYDRDGGAAFKRERDLDVRMRM